MTTKKEHLRNLALAASSAIPIVGGPISMLLDKYLPKFILEKKTRLLAELNTELERLTSSGEVLNLEDERFIALFIKCTNLAIQEFQEEKVTLYKNIILNSALPNQYDFDETTLFINWLQELTVDQIRIIKAIKFSDPMVFKDVNSGDIYQLLKVLFPSISRDYLAVIGQDLITKKIVLHRGSIYSIEFDKEKNNQIWFLSDLGEKFINYILSPKTENKST